MVLERLFSANWVEKKPAVSLFLGVIFTLVAFITSMFLFYFAGLKNFVGISTILFTVILTIPGIVNLFSMEEEIESEDTGSYFKNFFKEHEGIIDFHLYFFVGVFVVLFIISMVSPDLVFSQEQLYDVQVSQTSGKFELRSLPPIFSPRTGAEIMGVMLNNMYVMILAFILSLFYGTGALFLITLNASIFASSLARVVQIDIAAGAVWAAGLIASCHISIMFLHAIPELLSYFLAAIAGGVLSKAFVREKFWSLRFKRVFKDGVILMVAALLVVGIAAIIEVAISKRLFFAQICTKIVYPIIIIGIVLLVGVIYFEFHRKHRMFREV